MPSSGLGLLRQPEQSSKTFTKNIKKMNKRNFTELADYIIWTNNIAMEWLNQINNEQWNQLIISSFSSIRQTAVHIVSAQKIWIDYWGNIPHPVFLSAKFEGTKDELIEIWKETSTHLKDFIEEYPEENYLKEITFKWPRGEEGRMEFWQAFSHMINHSTYHRGQLVTLLRQAGFIKLSSTDLATYYRIHQQ